MTDIFLSYSNRDRDRVKPIRDALVAHGFDVFWDQAVPAATDWDTWIRRHLAEAKCAIVAWSVHSVASDNVRHEATMAKQQNKLVPVLLDPLGAEHFPMGLYAVQGANLASWTGDIDDPEWRKVLDAAQDRLTPRWIRRLMDQRDAELVAERARREAVERRDRTLRDQIAKEAQASQELRRERDDAREEVAALQVRVAGDGGDDGRRVAALSQQLRELDAQRKLLAEQNDAAERTIATLRQRLAGMESRSAPPSVRPQKTQQEAQHKTPEATPKETPRAPETPTQPPPGQPPADVASDSAPHPNRHWALAALLVLAIGLAVMVFRSTWSPNRPASPPVPAAPSSSR